VGTVNGTYVAFGIKVVLSGANTAGEVSVVIIEILSTPSWLAAVYGLRHPSVGIREGLHCGQQ
jgi:hypothetical protein